MDFRTGTWLHRLWASLVSMATKRFLNSGYCRITDCTCRCQIWLILSDLLNTWSVLILLPDPLLGSYFLHTTEQLLSLILSLIEFHKLTWAGHYLTKPNGNYVVCWGYVEISKLCECVAGYKTNSSIPNTCCLNFLNSNTFKTNMTNQPTKVLNLFFGRYVEIPKQF